MRTASSSPLAPCVSLFVQYTLTVTLMVLPFHNVTIQAQGRRLPASGSTTTKRELAPGDESLRAKAKPRDVSNLTEQIMGFAHGETSKEVAALSTKKSPADTSKRAQDPATPSPVPQTPGIGSGGTGPGGSFNVDPPQRVKETPAGVRSVSDVLNETHTTPTIPAPIPSTQRYCWPGDPACRKRPAAPPKSPQQSPQPRPTPPPRPKNAGASAQQSDLLLASNDWYFQRLMSSAMPYLSHLRTIDDSDNRYSWLSLDKEPMKQLFASSPAMRPVVKNGAASYIWADCTNVQGYADNASTTIYIYIDSANAGTAWAEGNGYFISDISSYVNDGGYHYVEAWYYTYDWVWVQAGSTSVSGCYPFYDFDNPRLDPPNETGNPGVNAGSQNINWSLPLVSLPGRGLDLNLLLTYNSLVWTQSADQGAIEYDVDHGFPSAGFRLRFPIIQPAFYNYEAGVVSYMLITSTGERVELRQVSANTYDAADSSYMRMVDYGNGNATVWLKDGTQMAFEAGFGGELRCREIKDKNGNFIKVDYNGVGNIDKVTDTLGRQVFFNYDVNYRLLTLSQSRAGLADTLVTFGYDNISFTPSFPGLNVFSPGTTTIPVLVQVGFPDGSHYNFEYTTFGQVNKIRHHEADNRVLSYVRYNLSTDPQYDCPRFSEERVWAENWNDNLEAVTTYSGNVTAGLSQTTTPDLVTTKQFYYTTGWQTGLIQRTETWFDNVKRKWTEMYWTQDNEGLPYQVNPRPNDIRVYDEAGNSRRTTIEYTSYGLPSNIRDYSGSTVLRRLETQYRFDAGFVDRRILGVVWMELIYEGESTLVSKLNYHHDWTDPDAWNGQTPSTGHDNTNYGSGFTWGRANITGVRRYNLSAPNDDNQAVWIRRIGYNAAGSPFKMKDALEHSVNISYTDSFSDGINRGTLAYPTSVTDPDGNTSTTQYHYDIGAITRSQDPKGLVETTQYDSVARLQQITNQFTGGYTRWEYTAIGELVMITKVDPTQGETVSVHYVDGAGRDRGTIGHLPNSTGQWRAQMWAYDIMGRLKDQTNPTEVTQAWQPTGDDAAGWVKSYQSYDWNGRQRVTTNQDGSTRDVSYVGCGCAGGDVLTIRDERGRRRKLFNDPLGRLIKVEELNWDQSVYSTTLYTYNARDQLTQSSQAGQLRSYSYDSHGRLQTRTTPEQGATTYAYNADDTVQTITDARNVVMTFSYNPRKLVTGITFAVSGNVAATPNVTFGYDSAGNRTSMSSTESAVTYGYDTASRLTSETRTFAGVSGSFALSYTYNQLDQLTEITNPWNYKVGYTYNHVGEVTAVTGQNYAGVSTYASGLVYRAFGGLKQMNYGNGRTFSASYNNRMQMTQWSVPGVLRWNYAYNYFNEYTGRVVYAQNLDDPTLDRAWDYDYAARPTHFTSGSNARNYTGQGGPVLNDGPYSQGYYWDQFGNRTYFEGWGGTGRGVDNATYTNNKRDGFVYDAAGNLTNDLGQQFTYDGTGQQASASYSGYSLQQTYDGDRMRVKKIENGTPTYFLRSSVLGGQIVAEISSSGAMNRGFVYVDNQLLAVQQGGAVSWVHEDPVAKSKRITNSSGTIVSTIEVDPWGGETTRSNNEAFQPKRFTSYYRDVNASDDAMQRRYNRWHARFDQPDPYGGSYDLTNPQSFNRYNYGMNDPVNFVDPNGLDPLGGVLGGWIGITLNPPSGSVTITGSFNDIGSGFFGAGDAGMRIVEDLPTEGNPEGPGGGGPQNTPQQQAQQLLNDCRIRAMLDAIAWAEGTARFGNNAYGLLAYGTVVRSPKHPELVGKKGTPDSPIIVSDTSSHPGALVRFRQRRPRNTSAAGRYQFLSRTWNGLGLEDFSPGNQDVGAVMLLQHDGSIQPLQEGNPRQAASNSRATWASLPGSPHGQPTRRASDFQKAYEAALANCQGK